MSLIKVAATDEVPEGEVRVFKLPSGASICVANVAGEYLAIDNVCTHDGGPLGEGSLWDGQVECPRHGARFDLHTGRAITLPAVRGVKTYPVKTDGDAIEVEAD